MYDFFEKNNELFIKTIGRKGNETINTHIEITSYKDDVFEIKSNQILLNDRAVTNDHSLKKKPILVNENELYYLTDYRSRRGVYTLKKIKIESIP